MKRIIIYIMWIGVLALAACAGSDRMPNYFGEPKVAGRLDRPVAPGQSAKKVACELKFTSQICVAIKGDKIDVGTSEEKKLCADVPPIPLKIEGNQIKLHGAEFPDIEFSGSGLPVPILINGKGDTSGEENVGRGTWSPDGDILIEHFSFFVTAAGQAGRIPDLTLTTGETVETPHLGKMEGAKAKNSGEVILAVATVLGPIFEAASQTLMGASLTAKFEGKLEPPLSQCQGASKEPQIQIVKLRRSAEGNLFEEPLAEGNRMEISHGTFMTTSPHEVGPKFENEASFKVTHIGKKSVEIVVPHQIGPFYFSIEGATKFELRPKQSFLFSITFRPTQETVSPGEVQKQFHLGGDSFLLVGIALAPEGVVEATQIAPRGVTLLENIDTLRLGEVRISATPVGHFFRCETKSCGEFEGVSRCQKCEPPQTQECQLLAVNKEGRPIREVDEKCRVTGDKAPPLWTMDLTETDLRVRPATQNLILKNRGTRPITLQEITLEESLGSKSTGQFQMQQEGLAFPITFEPPTKGKNEELSLVISYFPTDLIGSDGSFATAGRPVTDEAVFKIKTDLGESRVRLVGKTIVEDVPELSLIFTTATGLKWKSNGESFAFREVTAETLDLATPIFVKISEAATGGYRITEVRLGGEDASFFEWLDTSQEIGARAPPRGKGKRCSVAIFDAQGNQVDEDFDLKPVSLEPQGLDLKPGAQGSPPLLGCVNFHRDPTSRLAKKRLFEAELSLKALRLDPLGRLERNPDGSYKESDLSVKLLAAIDPIRGKRVLRITQTVAAILNPQFPSLAAMPSIKEVEAGYGHPEEVNVMLGALELDPFDEETILSAKGEVESSPGDGVTGVFRAIATQPSSEAYENPVLDDFASLLHDESAPSGTKGIFEGFPNVPQNLKTGGWRIFTGSLSYPGPLSGRGPINLAECVQIDPCSEKELTKFSDIGVAPGEKGACAFFYMSGGRVDSPGMANSKDLCETKNSPTELIDMNNGHYDVDGSVTFPDLALRFWGPTFFHNPYSPLGRIPPLHEVFPIAFTTEVLKPAGGPRDWNVLPDEKINFSRMEHKINLTESGIGNPALCPNNTRNRKIGGKPYSSWRYLQHLLVKDEAGEVPAGCPEPGNSFTGGTAFLRGRRLDPETGTLTLLTGGKFSGKESLTLAFRDVMLFVIINGWICDPTGAEELFEGPKCYDETFNSRDKITQFSMMDE